MGLPVKKVDAGKGVFDIIVQGRTVFSKHKVGRYPAPNEVVNLLRAGK